MAKYDNFFTDLANTQPYLKVAVQGQAGSGKSYTLALIAAGLYERIGSKKPIVIFDTERSAKFLRPFFAERGIPVLLKDSRSLSDLIDSMDYCAAGNAEILLIDSITHVYEGFLQAYQQKKGRNRIEFQDWGFLKPTWKREFSDRLVLIRAHVGFSGREGYTYSYEVNEETGKRELIKDGVRMKVEGETAYEPDVLIRMERYERLLGPNKEVWREATVIKDRADLIDGKVFRDPTYEDFKPVVEFLLSDVAEPTETTSGDDWDLIGEEDNHRAERDQCKILLERNNALLDQVAAGTAKDAKSLRLALMQQAYFGETSDLAISRMNKGQLEEANNRLTELVRLVGRISNGEQLVYPISKAADAARLEHLETTNLGEASTEQLTQYLDHLTKTYREMKKAAKPTEAKPKAAKPTGVKPKPKAAGKRQRVKTAAGKAEGSASAPRPAQVEQV